MYKYTHVQKPYLIHNVSLLRGILLLVEVLTERRQCLTAIGNQVRRGSAQSTYLLTTSFVSCVTLFGLNG